MLLAKEGRIAYIDVVAFPAHCFDAGCQSVASVDRPENKGGVRKARKVLSLLSGIVCVVLVWSVCVVWLHVGHAGLSRQKL
jgi:hypothetical protein